MVHGTPPDKLVGWLRRRRDAGTGPPGEGAGRPRPDAPDAEPAPDADPPGAADARNRETDRMFAYHATTKHTYAKVYGGGWSLDWDNQPNPFRRYVGAPRIPLPTPGEDAVPVPSRSTSAALAALPVPSGDAWPSHALPLLGSLLHHAMAVSAWKQVPGTDVRYSLRVNPSSGNLHPTETWIVAEGLTDLPDGLYHYDVRDHRLERRRDGGVLPALAAAAGLRDGPGILVVLTTIFWREAWKYRDRAYRYCLHDAGHAAASIATAARGLLLPAAVHAHFPDRAVADLLALDGTDEVPVLLLDLRKPIADVRTTGPADAGPSGAGPSCADSRPQPPGPPAGEPNALSAEAYVHPLIEGMHRSTLVEGGPCPLLPARADPQDEQATGPAHELPAPAVADEPLAAVVRRRRSAIDYRPEARMDAADFAGLLADATRLPRFDALGTLDGEAGARLVDLYCYVHGVDSVPPGCYRYRGGDGPPALVPIRLGDVRSAAAGLSLGQELAGHAICAFSMIADLGRGAAAFGNRAYRHAHVEAGMLGQGLYLAATARGLDATGIGAFFDDDVHRWLGLVGPDRQVIYHHSIGLAAPDPRLVDSDRPAEMRDDD
ncbi:MAG: SagB/ThcOx family dehydrogenase [Planctomycetota bacterium]|jgi:SagB-type dehydrogenase family enzyme